MSSHRHSETAIQHGTFDCDSSTGKHAGLSIITKANARYRRYSKTTNEDIDKWDFVTVRDGDPVRLYSSGNYQPLRGTVVTPKGEDKHSLYIQGYTPPIQTYLGPRIPAPITIEQGPEVCYSSYEEVCEENILFTKLDWNPSNF